MIIRLLVCFVVSILVHLLIIIQPLHFTTKPTEGLNRTSAVPVSLVDIPQQFEGLRDVKITPDIPDSSPMNKKDVEGVSFVAEGGVGVAYLSKLKVKIFRFWEYPEAAIQKGEQGNVSVAFVLNDKGEVVDMGVLSSSGSYSLDSAAMAAIKQAGPFGAFTKDIKDKNLKITGHFRYVLD